MTIQDIIQSIVLPVLTSGFVIWLFREWISARLKASIQHEYDQKIETHKNQLKDDSKKSFLELKNELDQKFDIYEAGQKSFEEGQRLTMKRKIHYIDTIWEYVSKIRSIYNLSLILSKDLRFCEFGKSDPPIKEDVRKIFANEFLEKTKCFFEDDEKIGIMQLYLGGSIWLKFFHYSLLCKMIFLQQKINIINNDDAFNSDWHREDGIRTCINLVLSKDEISEFDARKFGKLLWILNKFESKILDESRIIISGEKFSIESIKNATSVLQKTAYLQSKIKIAGVS